MQTALGARFFKLSCYNTRLMRPKFLFKQDDFVIENYQAARPYASFLPGIAGEYGKPMWVFTANRGQGICSFGIRNKNGAMLEFFPANKAYTMASVTGFRTFLKLEKGVVYEPFRPDAGAAVRQIMRVRPHELEVEEIHPKNALRVKVVFFTVPSESQPLLVRWVTVENLSRKSRTIEVADGLPQVVPFGLSEFLLKQMSRTMEAFAEVLHADDKLPFFKLKVEPSDRPEMERIHGGFYSFTFHEGKAVRVFVDPQTIFGTDTSFSYPHAWAASTRAARTELRESSTACAFASLSLSIKGGTSASYASFFGQAECWDDAQALRHRIQSTDDYVETKCAENASVLKALTDHFAIHSAESRLDPYSRQAFLDNTLRGGQPRVVGHHDHPRVFHYYTRKHGDMERDYNFFEVAPTFFSQGNGNFRDVNQNRRCETLLFAGVGSANVETFFNLIQLDGFNPLVIQFETFVLRENAWHKVETLFEAPDRGLWHAFLTKPFNPGMLFEKLLHGLRGSTSEARDIFDKVLAVAEKNQEASHGEGFWVDHWIYNLDLLESFAAVYPDRLKAVMTEPRVYTYFDSDHVVQPRHKKTILREDGKVRQMKAVVRDAEKAALLKTRASDPLKVRTQFGEGDIYRTSLLTKLLGLLVVKAASLDPSGIGLEMEADKPGWCDALNGLPGVFGSSVNETYTLLRGVRFLQDQLPGILNPGESIRVPVEVADFMGEVQSALAAADPAQFYRTWDALCTHKESFRERTRLGLSGEETALEAPRLQSFLSVVEKTLSRGVAKAVNAKGLVITYFIHEVQDFEKLPPVHSPSELADGKAMQAVRALRFKRLPVTPFLEGPMHALRSASGKEARRIYQSVRDSALYDDKLRMYRLNEPLDRESFEIGRAKIFAPGWLENESIFLHMHYKFMLETLRSGLVDDFFKDLKSGLVAFQDPAVYGRSVFENSSFIASSRFPDARLHGNGFVARLTGATAEWLTMVLHMGLGRRPFQWVDGDLHFAPEPTLAGWMFASKASGDFDQDTFGFCAFSKTWIVYRNPGRRDTWSGAGRKVARYHLTYRDGRQQDVDGRALIGAPARDLRDGKLSRVVIDLA